MATKANAIDSYKAARSEGASQGDACRRLMEAGLSGDEAADVCWHVETGAPEPRWLHEDGAPTTAARKWDRAKEDVEVGE